MRPLEGIKVVELASGCAGSGAGMYLADYGADVIKIEPPEGDPERHTPPLINGVGQAFLVFNRGKRSIVADQKQTEKLIAAADVLIVDHEAVDYEHARKLNPGLIYALVTPFGREGPLAGLPGYDPLVQAASGVMACSRTLEAKLIATGWRLSDGATPMLLTNGIMMALLARRKTGRGQRVDVTMVQTAIAMQSVQVSWALNNPVLPSESFSPTAACYRCSDGRYINVSTLQQRQFMALLGVLGLEHLLADPEIANRYERRAVLHPLFEGIYETRPSDEWLRLLDEAGVPCGPMLSRGELFMNQQVVENGLATVVEHSKTGKVHVLGTPISFSETPPCPGSRVPSVGEDRAEFAGSSKAFSSGEPGLPLEGVRVLDLAIMYAGPGTTAYLGDMGAGVIKVEAPTLDDSRRLQNTDYLGLNSRAFMALNRNKRGIVLDLQTERGREVMHRLVQNADVLLHNYRAGVPERLGVDYPTLSGINPRLIYVWVTGFGSKGPFRLKPAYDNVIQGYSGVYAARAQRDGGPTGGGTFVADTSMPMLAGFAIGAALWARERTGRGQLLEVPLLGMALATQAAQWVGTADQLDPIERACPVVRCPGGEYVCIALVQDEHWRCLCLALKHLEWFDRYPSWEARAAGRLELEELLAGVSAADLLNSGVPCAQVVGRNDLPSLPYTAGCFTDIEHPAVGPTRLFSPPARLSETPASIRFPAPTPGQHTDELLAEAGYSAKDIVALRAGKVVA